MPERVVIDASLVIVPPSEGAPCMWLEAGTLTVRAHSTNTGDFLRPATFRFFGYRGEDGAVHIDLALSNQESAITVPLSGAHYCWSVDVDAPVAATDGMAIRTNYSQGVALRMTFTPAQP